MNKVQKLVLLFAGLLLASPALAQQPAHYETGMILSPVIMLPKETPKAAVFLLSDRSGWSAEDGKSAQALVDSGSIVVGIDLPSYLRELSNDDSDCVYAVSDIEALSQQIQRSANAGVYHAPIVAGIGAGASLALAIAAQTPDATIAGTIAVDPTESVAVEKQFCTPAKKRKVNGGYVYGLTDGALPGSITVAFTDAADAAGRDHVEVLKKEHDDIDIGTSGNDSRATLDEFLVTRLENAGEDNPLGLPLTILDAKPLYDAMVVFYSGDGGWRDIDKEAAGQMQEQGLPVVGIDALRYFWSEQTPEKAAEDLGRIIDLYKKRWNVSRVLLIGYSFGADTLPGIYDKLTPDDKALVKQMSLLSLSRSADFQISVTGWLGIKGEGKGGDPVDTLKPVDPSIIQCIYGADDEAESGCPPLKSRNVETIVIEGGHHFDEDYEALADKVIASFKKRIGVN